jgi:PPOX class probable F420-dependent enzyme
VLAQTAPKVTPGEARRRFASARVARLATADAGGRPHIVPIVFAVEGDIIYSAVDHKPKRTTALRRLANIAENPSVALLVDYYDDDWSRLWWARADGTGRLVATGSDEQRQAISALQSRYVEYVERPPGGPVVAVNVTRWSGWLGGSGTV